MKTYVLVQFLLVICMSIWLSEANLEKLLKDKEKQNGSVGNQTGVFEC